MAKDFKDKIMFSFFILFLFIGGFTLNFYNSMPIMLRRICLIVSVLLLIIVITYMLIKKINYNKTN